jgi:hypothetical protein
VSSSLIRALRGPVVMMTLGGMFALDHFTPYRFTNTWPALLIVFGVMRLLERVVAPPPPPPSPPPAAAGGIAGGGV